MNTVIGWLLTTRASMDDCQRRLVLDTETAFHQNEARTAKAIKEARAHWPRKQMMLTRNMSLAALLATAPNWPLLLRNLSPQLPAQLGWQHLHLQWGPNSDTVCPTGRWPPQDRRWKSHSNLWGAALPKADKHEAPSKTAEEGLLRRLHQELRPSVDDQVILL